MPYTINDFENTDLWKIYENTSNGGVLEINVSPITGGTNGRILFQDNDTGVLQQSGFLYLDTSIPQLRVPNAIKSVSGTLLLGDAYANALTLVNGRTTFANDAKISGGGSFTGTVGHNVNIKIPSSKVIDILNSGGTSLSQINEEGRFFSRDNTGAGGFFLNGGYWNRKLDLNNGLQELGNTFLSYKNGHTGVHVGNAAQDPSSGFLASSIFTLTSTTQGFLPPVMTTIQLNAIPSPAEGLLAYDSTAKNWFGYNGTVWKKVGT